jgi:hypothetical protein
MLATLLVTVLFGTTSAHSAIFGTDDWSELKVNPGRPYNAVGFLNNGCTAFLIGPNHIAAAAHCFARTWDTGGLQTGLRFYPNYHPGRLKGFPYGSVLDDEVPRADVTRVVLPTRQDLGEEGNDWGIARVDNWRNTAGVDLTPIQLASINLKEFDRLEQPGYARHFLPVKPSHEWDKNCAGGAWYVKRQRAPRIDGATEQQGCNSRWAAGQIRQNCWVRLHDKGRILHTCDATGGNSGSPIIHRTDAGHHRVVGITGGGGAGPSFNDPNADNIKGISYDRNVLGNHTYAAPVERFMYAPRFASNVSVARRLDGSAATAVFGVDSDTNRVTYRARSGSNPSYSSEFMDWGYFGVAGTERPTRIASCNESSSSPRPRVFVIAGGKLYTRYPTQKTFSYWESIGLPSGVSALADVDTTNDPSTRCQVFVVAKDGSAYTRQKVSDTAWSGWKLVASGKYRTITASKGSNGSLRAMMIDTTGRLFGSVESNGTWSSAVDQGIPNGLAKLVDADFGYDEYGQLRIYAYGGSDLYNRSVESRTRRWVAMATSLWAPRAPDADKNGTPDRQPAPQMLTITASRWMEDAPGTTSPAIFATDTTGNVFFIEFARGSSGSGWVTQWKSFYTRRIPYAS